MLGWLVDLFRLVWGLFYWNLRKSWFRARRGRTPCPCQSPGDSGLAFDTRCDACLQWHRPERFRRVCPLLVETKEGLRCSVATAEVRPFWGLALRYVGGALLVGYILTVLGVFGFLRTVGYPVSVREVAMPQLWPRVTKARGWMFFDQSRRAFAAGRTAEGLLYLANAFEFDPTNYQIGLMLAKNYQVGQPAHSDEVFERLMREHPDRRAATAQDWFRALLARGNFERIGPLAATQTLADPAHAHVWIRALLFASRQSGDLTPLRDLLASDEPTARPWHRMIQTELHVRASRLGEARASLVQPWPAGSPPFTLYYRVNTLISLHDSFAAMDLLERHLGVLDGEAQVTLLLDAYGEAGATNALRREVDSLLLPRLNLWTAKILCAHLIRYPNGELFGRLCDKVLRENLPLNTETAGIWFSLLCCAGAVGDEARLHSLTQHLKDASSTPFVALNVVEAFFRGRTSERRITSILPILPLPLEVSYALIERYSTPSSGASINVPKRN